MRSTKEKVKHSLAAAALFAAAALVEGSQEPERSPNGIALPKDYRDWRVIGVSQRTDNDTLRAIIGNNIAVAAARAGQTNPWPEGSMLGKVVWKAAREPSWPTANVPGELVHVEFMVKDPRKYADTGGWGFARWRGTKLEPHGKDAGFAQECFGCHTPVKARDYVFTRPAAMPASLR